VPSSNQAVPPLAKPYYLLVQAGFVMIWAELGQLKIYPESQCTTAAQ